MCFHKMLCCWQTINHYKKDKTMLTSKFYAACLSAALLCSPLAFAENAHPLVREKNLEMAEISEKTLFRELYADVMTSAYLDEESELARSLKKMPYVGIRANPQEQEQVAFMHRPQIYYNAKGEKRALVMVEKHRVEEGGRLVECHACAPEVDLFVLAPQDQGWRLLSSTKVQSEISGSFGDNYLEFIKYNFTPIGAVDLVTYFFRRIFGIIKEKGFQSLISTNTIAQGKAREDGLDIIVKQGGTINHAIKSMRWPGIAAVEVALLTITKQNWKGKFVLGGKYVKVITPYLDDAETLGNPYQLKQNENKAFQGSIPLGKGFVLEPVEAQSLIAKDSKNKDVLFPYLNGDDLNNNPDQSPSRWVINFFDWDEMKSREYTDCFSIIEKLVKPERHRPDNKMGRDKWWQFYRRGVDLYNSIKDSNDVIALCEVTKHLTFTYVKTGSVYTANLDVFSIRGFNQFSLVQNSFHYYWAWTYCAWLKRDLKYSPGNGFQTFPFPQNLTASQEQNLEAIGEAYHEHRRQLMLKMQLGLTKTYNAFHAREIQENLTGFGNLLGLDKKTIEKQYGKEVWNLWNHLSKTEGTCSMEEAVAGIIELRRLHVLMDEAVLEAYGWDLPLTPSQGGGKSVTQGFHAQGERTKSGIALRHDFYEVDYLPENDRVRYTIHPEARKEILKRLLELNHKIHAEEVEKGLWEKKKTTAKKSASKSKPYETKVDASVMSEPRIEFE